MARVVIVVGMPGSGKDVFVQTARELGFGRIGMGDVVRDFAARATTGTGDRSIGGFADSERKAHGPAVWAERTLEMMPPGNIVIDGSRSLDEIAFFREQLGATLVVIAIVASEETRFKRLKLRMRDDDPLIFDDFLRRDAREKSWGLAEAIASAEVKIRNESDIGGFRKACMAVLERILDADGKSI